jgi:hypothetical protein
VSITETELQLEFVMYTYVLTVELLPTTGELCSADANAVIGTIVKNKDRAINNETSE